MYRFWLLGLLLTAQGCASTARSHTATRVASHEGDAATAPDASEPGARVAPPPIPVPLVEPAATPLPEPEVTLDADALVVHTPAGAMRRFPGPSSAGSAPAETIGFEGIRGQLNDTRVAMRRCYANALQRDPDQQGKLAARVVFDAEGRTSEVEITERSSVSDELSRCLAAALRRLRTSPGAAGRQLTIPFVLVR